MTIPNLMPFQMQPFNGDTFIESEFLKLRDKFNIEAVVETGTCLGSTTIFLSKNFNRVLTIESNIEYLTIAHERFKKENLTNIYTELGDSSEVLYPILIEKNINDNSICWLDAHWGENCPLKDEITAIYHAGLKPVIVIHDFFVPNRTDLGFDTYKGQPFTIEWLKPELDLVYGEYGYNYEYNSSATGAMRGIVYVTKK